MRLGISTQVKKKICNQTLNNLQTEGVRATFLTSLIFLSLLTNSRSSLRVFLVTLDSCVVLWALELRRERVVVFSLSTWDPSFLSNSRSMYIGFEAWMEDDVHQTLMVSIVIYNGWFWKVVHISKSSIVKATLMTTWEGYASSLVGLSAVNYVKHILESKKAFIRDSLISFNRKMVSYVLNLVGTFLSMLGHYNL